MAHNIEAGARKLAEIYLGDPERFMEAMEAIKAIEVALLVNRRRGPSVPLGRDDTIEALWRAGEPARAIGAQFGIGTGAVMSVLSRRGVGRGDRPSKTPRLPSPRDAAWAADFRAGIKIEAIATEARVSRQRVQQVLSRMGLAAKDGGARRPPA